MPGWTTGLFDCTAAPGGLPLCLWSCCCCPCAAGDVAANTGGNYLSTCLLMGFGIVPFTFGIPAIFACCHRCRDRKAAADKTNVQDPQAGITECCKIVCCVPCTISQELREIAHASTGASKDMDVFKEVACRVPDAKTVTECPVFCLKLSAESGCAVVNAAKDPKASLTGLVSAPKEEAVAAA